MASKHYLKCLINCKLLIVLLTLCSQHATAQEIFILGANGDLHSIDPSTGQGTYIGSTGHHTYLWNGLAQNSQGQLFASTGDWMVGYSIFEIDPLTGAGTFVTDTNFTGLGSIAFGPGDELYVGHDPKFPASGGIYDLYTLDINSGIETLIGSTGAFHVIAMDFDGTNLYGHNSGLGLMEMDLNSGLATDVNDKFKGRRGPTASMCFDDNGALYFIDDALWMMDPDSGLRNPVDWISPFGYWGEAVFREGPTPNFALWLDGTAGHYMGAKMTGATPNSQVMLMWAKGEGGPTPIPPGLPCPGRLMDLNSNMGKVAIANTDATGSATIGPGPRRVPVEAAGLVWLQAIDVSTCNKSNRIQLRY
ncbi:MAG: hypothetical protein H8E15_10555 [Planctomycetes bacterium]|nr:hypothetical protein [Planctomycetota bacterium]